MINYPQNLQLYFAPKIGTFTQPPCSALNDDAEYDYMMCNKSEKILIFPVTCAESVNLTTPWAEFSGTYHKTDQVNCILGRLGPEQLGPGHWTVGPQTVKSRGPIVHFCKADSWARGQLGPWTVGPPISRPSKKILKRKNYH